MEAPLRGGALGPLRSWVILSHWSGGVGVLVEIADQAGNEKLTAVKTRNQEKRPRVTICLERKRWETSPYLMLRGATKSLQESQAVGLGDCRGNRVRLIADIGSHVVKLTVALRLSKLHVSLRNMGMNRAENLQSSSHSAGRESGLAAAAPQAQTLVVRLSRLSSKG